MINLNVYIDDKFYGVLNCDNDGDLWNRRLSLDGRFYTYWEDQWLDGGTSHIIEFHDSRYYHDRGNGSGYYDFLNARTIRTGEYSNGKKYRELVASRVNDLVAQEEWRSALGRKVVFKLAD